MALPASGHLCWSQVQAEIKDTSVKCWNDPKIRKLTKVATGSVCFPKDFYGKSAGLEVEYLIVAAGGGSGWAIPSWHDNGGGGAGGMLEGKGRSISGAVRVVVGQGVTPDQLLTRGTGEDSSFDGLVAKGGGQGAGNYTTNPAIAEGSAGFPGGSGGGASAPLSGHPTIHPGGKGVAGQGNDGGAGGDPSQHTGVGGGGGGAGGPGHSGDGATQGGQRGTGGPGKASSITGRSVTYAIGGTGANGRPQAGWSIAPNTGNGAGNGTGSSRGQAGSSGVVIIAYPGTTAQATGGTISTSSRPGWVVHTFTSSGTFTPT